MVDRGSAAALAGLRARLGLTTGEISVHFPQIYGASVSKETIGGQECACGSPESRLEAYALVVSGG